MAKGKLFANLSKQALWDEEKYDTSEQQKKNLLRSHRGASGDMFGHYSCNIGR